MTLALLVFGVFLVIPLLAFSLISYVIQQANQRLVRRFGWRSVLWFSWLGIVVHESSHALMALLFRHEIDQIKFFQAPDPEQQEQRLGYVSHAWNPASIYQTLGNVFIGCAPIFGITGALLGMTAWLWPSLFPGGAPTWPGWWQGSLWFVLVVQLVLGFDLSRADWLNIRRGIWWYILVLGAVTVILLTLGVTENQFWYHCGIWVLAFFGGILTVASVIALCVKFITR